MASRLPRPAAFKHVWKQGASFMQQARQFWTWVSYLGVVEQSPTGGHEREPELVQVPAAAVKEKRESKGKSVEQVSCIVRNDPRYE